MPVGTYCKRPAVTVGPDETARAAAELLDRENLGCLIVAEKNRPVGIVTDRDLALELLTKRLDPGAVRVKEIAVPRPITVEEDAPVAEAAQIIRRHGLRRLPVVDKKGELVGVIAADDLMQLVVGELVGLANAVYQQCGGGEA